MNATDGRYDPYRSTGTSGIVPSRQSATNGGQLPTVVFNPVYARRYIPTTAANRGPVATKGWDNER